MYTPTQLAIIERFGRKELTEGCRILIKNKGIFGYLIDWSVGEESKYDCITYMNNGFVDTVFRKDAVILGHIPHLEDVFRVAKNKLWYYELLGDSLEFWNELGIQKDTMQIDCDASIPLLDQSKDTLQSILNLFPND